MAGTMHLLQQRTVPHNPVSSADHSDFTQEAAAFAARALAYEYTYAHITALSSTSTMGFHRFPFLELVSDTLSSSIQPDIDHSASLDALLHSLSLQKGPSAQPPLIAAALALYQQLATAPLEVQAFCCAHLPRLRAADPWEKFSSTLLAMVHEYMQTCELPIDLAWQDQLQLAEAILCSDWCDMRSEVRATRRKRDRQIRDAEKAVLASIIPRQILGDSNSSVSSYLKRRKDQHMVRPAQCGKVKSHSPADRNLGWDSPAAMDVLKSWPTDIKINWSAEAEKLSIPGANRGQVLKEIAIKWHQHCGLRWKVRTACMS